MNELDHALAQISAIRDQMSRSTEFRGYGPMTIAATGVLALAAAEGQALLIADPAQNMAAYLGLWIATAAIAVLLVAAETVTRSRLVHSGLAQEMIVTAVEQFLPAIAAGVLVTVAFYRVVPDSLWTLPGLWQIFFSLGIFASCRFLPRALSVVGIWYMAAGLTCLVLARGEWAFHPWAMGIPFSIGQLLGALILQRSATA